ncbi:DUF1850 domain-containing protein [Haloarcula sp. S1AR25-5A]|uniref:DUF1850 domain-containing protein n=1 Tax=Haloarcula terrestris TaxID=2950533 RepID=A0AAE4JH25_9EURY|nr:DUF1850 domain-containing protein [Haloarcula terrestris]MDS0220114.1 DUF1850 domain-containing protein [Haloarcula terrestris]
MRRRYVAIAAILALLLIGSVAALPGGRVLVVEDAETGEQYMTVPVEDGTIVALEYMHSVEKTRVYDEYTVRGDHLEMTRMEFESFGWGLPSGANVTRENGMYVFDPPGNYTRVTVAPGEVAGHKLHVGAESYDLVARTNGRSVHIHVARRSAVDAVTDQFNT